MRITALVLGLVSAVSMFIQSILVAVVGGLGAGLGTLADDSEIIEEAEEISAVAGAGIIAAIIGFVAAGLAIKYPRASMILFTIAAVIAISSGAGSAFSDLVIWGVLFAICAVFSFFGQRKGRRWQRMPANRQITPGEDPKAFCSKCGRPTQPDHQFCVGCGTALT